jgi:hypothetical protein
LLAQRLEEGQAAHGASAGFLDAPCGSYGFECSHSRLVAQATLAVTAACTFSASVAARGPLFEHGDRVIDVEVRAISDETDGNPFFIREVLIHLVGVAIRPVEVAKSVPVPSWHALRPIATARMLL